MSQFDLPRVNFHGQAILNAPTANNGNYEGKGLTMFNQDRSEAYVPPRIYLDPAKTYPLPPDVHPIPDNGREYIPIEPIDHDNYQQWAITPLGKFATDNEYWPLYDMLGLTGQNPGYWNYYGDLSVQLKDAKVTGLSMYDLDDKKVVTYNEVNKGSCSNAYFAGLIGAEFSFNNNFLYPGSQTTAYMCDADSIGQMCTQIFCGQVGLYQPDDANNQTCFIGTPVKSTARWMNLQKVLNYANPILIPMGGSASFYSMVEISGDETILDQMQQVTGKRPDGLLMKLMIHEVYEVREPAYHSPHMPTQTVYPKEGKPKKIYLNQATASITGSLTPYYNGDMKTSSIARLLYAKEPVTIDTSGIPEPQSKLNGPLETPTQVNMAPVLLSYDPQLSVVSLDVSNAINEYGSVPGALAEYAGPDDIPPFTQFETYDFGTFGLEYLSEDGTPADPISFSHDLYSMEKILETGGMVDLPVPMRADNYSGRFALSLNGKPLYLENDIYITSDQMGNYAEQNQADANYMSDGLPKGPCVLRVFHRGTPVPIEQGVWVTKQSMDMRSGTIINTEVQVHDGMELSFPVDKDGCMTYAFIAVGMPYLSADMSNLMAFVVNTSMIVLRTLSSKPHLAPYLNGDEALTWPVVYKEIFELYQTLYPIMDRQVPFTEANWSDSNMLATMLGLIDEANWNKPLYMPITRDLTDAQRQLLTLWAQTVQKKKSNE